MRWPFSCDVQTVVAVEPDLLPTTPRTTTLGNALDALAAAVLATVRRFTHDQPAVLRPKIDVLTRGQVLAPADRLRGWSARAHTLQLTRSDLHPVDEQPDTGLSTHRESPRPAP